MMYGNEPVNVVIHPVSKEVANSGLTKREYFAAIQPQIVDEFSQESMIIIMGSEPPSDRLENIKWWLLAESTLRVMKADALIEALNKTK